MKLEAPDLLTFLTRPTPTRRAICGDWLKERMSVLISGQSGAGKSFFVQSLALAIAGGKSIFGWEPHPNINVGILDGENDDEELQERITAICFGLGVSAETIKILSRSVIEEQLGRTISLSDPSDQRLVLDTFKTCHLIIVDNVNCCFDVTDENSTKDWISVQSFVMAARKDGKSLILVHHTPKSNPNSPAGSSKNVRPFDYSLLLSRREGANAIGVSFDLQIHKSRRSPGDLKPIHARLLADEDALRWITSENEVEGREKDQKRPLIAQIKELRAANCSYQQIEMATGVKRSTAQRWMANDEQ
jgi:hypothetical protein